jgi:hypothetical protein
MGMGGTWRQKPSGTVKQKTQQAGPTWNRSVLFPGNHGTNGRKKDIVSKSDVRHPFAT